MTVLVHAGKELLRPGVDTGEVEVVADNSSVLAAINTVITYTITDVFDLTPEEVVWVRYHIEEALAPFKGHKVVSMATPVRHQLITGEYDRRLSERSGRANPGIADGKAAQADVLDWATVLANLATQTYDVRPIIATGFVGTLAGVLTELGVGHPTRPRASKYLPNAIRFLANG